MERRFQIFRQTHQRRGQLSLRQLAANHIFKPREPRRKPPKPPLDLYRRRVRRLTTEDRMRIVDLRYGSLVQLGRPRRTLREVSCKLRIPLTTVATVIRNYLQRGRDFQAMVP